MSKEPLSSRLRDPEAPSTIYYCESELLIEAADTIESLTAELDALKDEAERLRQWYADSHRIIDEWDTKCSALRAENGVTESVLRANHIRIHIMKNRFYSWIVAKADREFAKTLPVIMRETEPSEQQP